MSNNLEVRPGPKDKKKVKVFVLDTKVSVSLIDLQLVDTN
jgi:hypothetical protein